MLLEIIIMIALGIAALLDLKYRKISNYLVVFILIIGIINTINTKIFLPNIIGIVFPAVILIVFKLNKYQNIGFGDIKLVMAIGLFYGYFTASIILMLTLILIICYALIMKRKTILKEFTIPFAPFIAIISFGIFIIKFLI